MLIKVCTVCNEGKELERFDKQKAGKYSVASICKSCRSTQKKQHYKTNREVITNQRKQWRDSHREVVAEYRNRYYENNRDYVLAKQQQYRETNKEAVKYRQNNWYQNNTDKVNAKNARRNARKLLATPSWADQKVVDSFYKQASSATFNGTPTHVDHIVPLQSPLVCGLHCEANLQLLVASDNKSKGNRYWPDMW